MGRKIYIVARQHGIDGLGAILFPVLAKIFYADATGCIPIVDMQHYYNQYFKDGKIFKENTWEYFFEQPCGLSLADIKEDDDVVIAENKSVPDKFKLYTTKMIGVPTKKNIQKVEYFKNNVRPYLKLNAETQAYVDKICYEKLKDSKNTLGVLCRGTDYTRRKPYRDPIQPSPKKVLKDAKKLMQKNGYEKIYLATEDAAIYEMFRREFGDKLIENNQYMYKDNYNKEQFLSQIKVDRPNHNYQLGLEYLASLYILSKCRGFLGGPTSGSKTAYLLADNWDYFKVYYYGLYGIYNSSLERIFSIKKYTKRNNRAYVLLTILGIKLQIKLPKSKKGKCD